MIWSWQAKFRSTARPVCRSTRRLLLNSRGSYAVRYTVNRAPEELRCHERKQLIFIRGF